MKRKIKIKPRFWVILATFIVVLASLFVGCNKEPTIEKTSVIEEEAKDFLLDIPMADDLQEQLYMASEEFGVDYYIMIALIEKESKFMNVVGDGGKSYGFCQIQPQWWYGLMSEIGATDLKNPKDNFRTACAIIAQLTEKHQSIEGALVEYNQGKYYGRPTAYSKEIMENAERYRA